ncbi:BQ5605_C002g01160 [Microbotryum silenes-dioicae]|uniref:BQ5605_C002g01160 protein n=1 Tax=Microbotryum silenes-dioicae TaxID=796604 RepID=A0A2X0M2H5_9BASI|nr:BQ5605_C002g01160 [Microbotryum silenes-dioicae]
MMKTLQLPGNGNGSNPAATAKLKSTAGKAHHTKFSLDTPPPPLQEKERAQPAVAAIKDRGAQRQASLAGADLSNQNKGGDGRTTSNSILGRQPHPKRRLDLASFCRPQSLSKDGRSALMNETEPETTRRCTRERVVDRADWEWSWTLKQSQVRGRDLQRQSSRSATFFPFAHLPGLGHLQDVLAYVVGAQVKLIKFRDVGDPDGDHDSESESARRPRKLKIASHTSATSATEKYHTCAWSVDTRYFPHDPILAVAGKSRVINLFRVRHNALTNKVELLLERRMTGFGEIIRELKFSPQHPHCLAVACDDGGIYLLDPTVEQGSDEAVAKSIKEHLQRQGSPPVTAKPVERPAIPGELRALLLTHHEYNQGMLSVDIHPRLPLVVASARDGRIFVWSLPRTTFGPGWPSPDDPTPWSRDLPIIEQFDPPIFISSLIHPGHVSEQVCWALSTTCHILSRAAHTYVDVEAGDRPRRPMKELKLWIPHMLDTLPNGATEQHAYTSQLESTVQDRVPAPICTAANNDPRPNGSNLIPSSAFTVDKTLILTDIDVSSFAVHRPPLTDPRGKSPIEETLVAFMTAFDPALFMLRPFALEARAEENLQHQAKTWLQSLDSIAATLLPKEPRPDEEYRIDWSPDRIINLSLPEDGQMPIFRSLAVSPNGAKWVAGVGENGLISWWRRTRVSQKADSDDSEMGSEVF